jgi:RHS repeat-associated protein
MKRMSFRFFPLIATLIAVLFLHTTVKAGHVDASQRIYTPYGGTQVEISKPSATKTVDLSPKTGSFVDHRVINVLEFGVDHHYEEFVDSSMEVRVVIHVEPFDASNSALTDFYESLSISYHPYDDTAKFLDKAIYKFSNAYKVTFTIDSIFVNGTSQTILPHHLYLEGRINAERYYDFTSDATDTITGIGVDTVKLDCDTLYDEIVITWPVIAGAEEYQLEWTFVNDYLDSASGPYMAASALTYDFRNNSTRITTSYTSYTVPLLFDHGYVLFRLRAVGVDYLNPDQVIFGVWSEPDVSTVNTVSSKFHITVPHEAALNWQVTTTFAEDGKKKEVLSYFDGSLRNRQTVTRINSDNNVIVGETIYDHQGRPAVTVLPAPVTAPTCTTSTSASLQYYPNFNQDTATSPTGYARGDFDLDSTGNACSIASPPMGTQSGASKYYSVENPDKAAQQAYVPDAEGYPYVRVEYTPDNTGRIRRQGGVGPEFQLGSNHETFYYYGQPNQIQLDRLFGSEVGDAAHYKKNIVIDPNGQVSVSYLDQEGRVVATALAGDEAPNTTAISSEATAADSLTVDLFAENANGVSLLNTTNVQADAIVFTSQMLVAYAGGYFFDYNLLIDTLYDACLDDNICFNCVYDLEIQITDECGTHYTPGDSAIDTHVGHFTLSGDTLGFTLDCESPTTATRNDTFSVYLPVGNYTVSKILRVNEQAVDFYVAAYLDSTVNTCFKTLADFQAEYLANVDTSDCYVDCDECLAALGDRDDWVAAGNGTALEYDFEAQKCADMCKLFTPCEASYQMMLMDVSPGGQYAQYQNSTSYTVDPSQFPLSVLNTTNMLPFTMQCGDGNWHEPLAEVNGTNYTYYFDDNGDRSKIWLTWNGTNYTPSLIDTALNSGVFEDAASGYRYAYPENLANVSDFIANWKSSWAKSLVQYHPEYCYYETCREYSEYQIASDSLTSDDFDNLLRTTETFDDAITAGFIKSTHASFPDPNDRVNDWFTLSYAHPYDPFVTNSGTFGTYSTALSSKFSTYIIDGASTYTMLEAAAMAARCGSNYGILPTATCMDFGADWIPGGPSAVNDSIRDLEWTILKSFYLSAKTSLQNDRGDDIALNSCSAFNDCIGAGNDFNPLESGMINVSPFSMMDSPYFDQGQPCSSGLFMLYSTKQKRFPDTDDVPQVSAEDAAYQVYLQTGQCPLAFQLQELLTALAQKDALDSLNADLMQFAQYNALYIAQNGFAPQYPITIADYMWNGDTTITGDTLMISWTDPDNSNDTMCRFMLDKGATDIAAWDDIIGFRQLQSTGTDLSGNSTFTVLAMVASDSGDLVPWTYKEIAGYSSCLQLDSCLFPESCDPTQFATDIQLLMTALALKDSLLSSDVHLESDTFNLFVSNRIRLKLGTPNTDLRWTWNGTDQTFTIEDNSGTNKIIFQVIAPLAGSFSNINTFTNLNPSYENVFTMTGIDDTGGVVAEMRFQAFYYSTDTTGISMGDCGHPTPLACDQREHHVREDLEALLREKLTEQPFTGDINLFAAVHMTPLLMSYLADSVDTTYSNYNVVIDNDTLYDTLSFVIESCYLDLWHINGDDTLLVMDSLVSIDNLTGIGLADANGNYHDFYFIAQYKQGDSLYTDTVYGSSCWPLKNCFECPDTSALASIAEFNQSMMMMSMMAIQQQDSVEVMKGEQYFELSADFYKEYAVAVDSLNARYSWTPTDTQYVEKVTYAEYAQKGYKYGHEEIVKYIDHFDTLVDNPDLIIHPDSFLLTYGNSSNAEREYERYTAAVQSYNTRAQNMSLATMTVISDSVFYHARYADSSHLYVKYLSEMPVSSPVLSVAAQDIQSWFNTNSYNYPTGDTCSTLYAVYVESWRDFVSAQQNMLTCPNYQLTTPLYTYGEFLNRNLCANNAGLTSINNYITSINNIECRIGLPYNDTGAVSYSMMKSGEGGMLLGESESGCEDLYIQYLKALKSYNGSCYADSMDHHIDTLYWSYEAFYRAGMCNCIESYLAYLESYYVTCDTTMPLPDNLDEYPGCQQFTNVLDDPCKDAYADYYNAALDYNTFVTDGGGAALGFEELTTLYTWEQFTSNELCYCVDEFLAVVDAIEAGLYNENPELAWEKLHFKDACIAKLLPPCRPNIPLDTFISPIVPYENPCVQNAINNALANAQLAYDNYVDSLTTVIADRYRSHCLGAEEDFTARYQDKEYHYTLYYYDQAGNLIKTVPPEGVELLDIDEPTDADEVAIQNDRLNGTQTVFTQHRMATRYEYNSLNQLVRQSMPDQDNMDIWETSLPNGLDSRFVVTNTQFVSPTRGYCSGGIDYGSGVTRGMVYVTDDGGSTWKRFGGEVGADINKIFWASSSIGYAVGQFGTVLKTTDGGSNWDQLNTFGMTQVGASNTTNHLNDLYFTSTTSGVMVGDNALLIYTTNGGTSFTMEDMTTGTGDNLLATDDITSVTYDGTNYYITVTRAVSGQPSQGLIFKSSNLISWTQQTSISTTAQIEKVSYYTTSEAYACGQDGMLLRTEDDGANWQVVPTSTANRFIDVFFRTQDEGLAIIETSTGEGQLHKTTDGGLTWTLFSDAGDDYNGLFTYENAGSTAKLVAVGDDGLVTRVIIQSGNFGLIPLDAPNATVDLNTAWATTNAAGDLWIYVAGNSSTVYRTTDGTASYVTWTSYSTGVSNPDNNFVRLECMKTNSGNNPGISGTLLSSTGKLFSMHKLNGSTTHNFTAFTTPTPGSNNFKDIQQAGSDSALVAFNATDKKLYKVVLSGISATTSAATIAGTVLTYNTSVTMSVNTGDALLGGSDGTLVRAAFSISGSSVTETDQSDNIANVSLNSIEFSGSGGKVYAAGNDGNFVQQNSAGVWRIIPSSTAEDIQAQNYNTTTTGLACGANGTLISYTVGSTALTTTEISTGTAETLNDITRSGNAVYMAGDNGTLLVSNNITLATPVINVATVSTAGDLHGVAFVTGSSTTAISVGDHAHFRWCYGQNSMQNTRVFTPLLRSVHFDDATNGYLVGDKFTARYSNDGGNTWNVIIPSSTTVMGANLSDLRCVYTHEDGTATIAGTVRYAGRVSSGVATAHSITGLPAGTTFNAVDFSADDYGALVGGAGTSSVSCHSTNMGVSWTYNTTLVSGTNLRAVKTFYRNGQFSYLTAGSNTTLKYWNGSSFTSTACTLPGSLTGVTFTDFFFHDDINGYLVGNKGVIMKTDAFAYSTGTGLYTTGNWTLKESDDDLAGQTDSTKMIDNSVAFSSRYNGFVGGAYNTSANGYARLVRDESDIFSTYFWYDKLGRIVLSQNSRQYAESIKRYSYTTYDELGRVSEAGEKHENDPTALQMINIFGSYVSNHFNPKVIDDDTLSLWLDENSGLRTEVTRTYYDTVNTDIAVHLPSNFDQTNLRKRVVHVTYSDTLNAQDSIYNHATHYTYDIHGNVNTLVQDNPQRYSPGGAITTQRYKRLDYEYDLISGNVNQVSYEKDSADMMLHRYEYDADNRIQTVETSTDDIVWDQDAKYIYYAHGPLARVELGENSVQGLDYAYTLQGWIKGVNSNTLDTTRDMGTDADTLTGNANAYFGKDVFGYSLNYYNGDYAPIDTSKWNTVTRRWEADKTGSDLLNAREDFYNGNISAMVTTITDTNGVALPQGMAYTYDQLNRLLNAKAYVNISMANNNWQSGSTYRDRYYNAFTYDANGNILTQDRFDQSGNQIEDLTYQYAKNGAGDMLQNRLYHVNDNITAGAFTDDIDDQGTFSSNLATINSANNYEYDGEGRLVRDSIEEIDTIKWTVTGKVKTVQRTTGSSKKNLKFDYDAMGQRIAKHVYDDTWTWEKSTYYVRDPQGNVMAVYDQEVQSSTMSYKVKERDIYGSSRVGMYTDTVEMIGAVLDTTNSNHMMGARTYELSNHLGNVLATISDKVIPKDWNSDATIDNFHADLVSSTDYYAFGCAMKGRVFEKSSYRYHFNGQEKTDEWTGNSGDSYDFGARMYDSRLGRWMTLDPLFDIYADIAPYVFVDNNPMHFTDPNGEVIHATFKTWTKLIVRAIKDKELRQKLWAQQTDKRVVTHTRTDSKGVVHEREGKPVKQHYWYYYSENSDATVEDAINSNDAQRAADILQDQTSDKPTAMDNHHEAKFGPQSEKMKVGGAEAKGSIENNESGPRTEISEHRYHKGQVDYDLGNHWDHDYSVNYKIMIGDQVLLDRDVKPGESVTGSVNFELSNEERKRVKIKVSNVDYPKARPGAYSGTVKVQKTK